MQVIAETRAPALADTAATYLLQRLTSYGNQVSTDHETALKGLLWLAEALSTGNLTGRYRFGLPCGMGKTTAVRAFIRTCHSANTPTAVIHPSTGLGGFGSSVVVACSKVEQLCALKRQLITEDGVPADRIGLMHSYLYDPKRAAQGREGYASEPSEGHDRPVLLVTHANLKAGELKPWMTARPGALVFYDESLIVAESMALPLLNETRNSLAFEVAGLQAAMLSSVELAPLAAWAQDAFAALLAAVKGHHNSTVLTVKVPEVNPEDAAKWQRIHLMQRQDAPNLSMLLKLAETSQQLRVFSNDNGTQALLSYTVSVPDELSNVIVLDASDPVRELVHHDKRMQRAEDVVPLLADFRDIPGALSSVKRNDRVSIYFAKEAGGRKVTTKQFREAQTTTPKSIEKLVRLVKSKPAEAFLIFTYKDRDGVQYGSTILKALEKAGVDLREQLPDGNFRICVCTWGQETASNEYRHCQNVVLLGVIFQPEESIAGTFLGQVDNLKAPEMHSVVRRLQYAECVHSIYQAANRGSMRIVDVIDGKAQAQPCSLYVIHNDATLRDKLSVVMPGATWTPWREADEGMTAAEVALLIEAELTKVAAGGYDRVTLRELKKTVAPTVPTGTWQRARDIALKDSPWCVSGQSLVLHFKDESAIEATLEAAANF